MNETTIPDTPQDAAAVGAQLVRDVRPCARYPHLATRAELEDEIDRLRGLLEQAAVDLVRADMARAQIVAAERERWEGIVCNALDLYDRLETRRGMEMLADLVAHKRA